ncbi:MAG: DUF1508 domain-containing protein [Devosia sp.]
MHFVIYQDTASQWRWRIRRNGNYKIMADSAESYWNKKDCLDAIDLVQKYAGSAPIYEN